MYQIRMKVQLKGVDGSLTLSTETQASPVDLVEAHAKALATQLQCEVLVLQAGGVIKVFDFSPGKKQSAGPIVDEKLSQQKQQD